jgi:hypothetical protein
MCGLPNFVGLLPAGDGLLLGKFSYRPRRYVLMMIDLPNRVPFHASLSWMLIASLFIRRIHIISFVAVIDHRDCGHTDLYLRVMLPQPSNIPLINIADDFSIIVL